MVLALLLPALAFTPLALRSAGAVGPWTQVARSKVLCAETLVDSSGAPIKAALSSYMHFCAERRSSLSQELKASMGAEFQNKLVMSGLGAEWKTLGEESKAKFAAIASADKERYDAAVASNPDNKTKKKKKTAKKEGPKKLSAYMHFCAERRSSVTAALKESMGSEFKNTAVMSALGAAWKEVDEAEKARFQQLAALPVE